MSENAKLFHIMAEKMFEIGESKDECAEIDNNDVSQVLWALGNYFNNIGKHSTEASALLLASALAEDDCDCTDDCVHNLLHMLSCIGYLEEYKGADSSIYLQTAINY